MRKKFKLGFAFIMAKLARYNREIILDKGNVYPGDDWRVFEFKYDYIVTWIGFLIQGTRSI